jgi:hypothetical protein
LLGLCDKPGGELGAVAPRDARALPGDAFSVQGLEKETEKREREREREKRERARAREKEDKDHQRLSRSWMHMSCHLCGSARPLSKQAQAPCEARVFVVQHVRHVCGV